MSKRPAVSVVIPTHNRAHLLGRALQSVINQTFGDWELLVVDDGSTDHTEEVVASFGDCRIRYIGHEATKGPAAARNTGIRESRSQYIAFLDSDDEFLPAKLERQLSLFFKDTDLGVVACDFFKSEGSFEIVKTRRPLRGWVYDDLLERRSHGYSTSLLMVNRDATKDELIFDESLAASEDFELLVRLAAVSRFDYVSEPLVKRHFHPGPRVHVGLNVLRGREQFIQKHANEMLKRPKVLRGYHLWLAHSYWQRGDKASTRRDVASARAASPLIHALYYYLLSTAIGIEVIRKLSRLPRVLRRRLGMRMAGDGIHVPIDRSSTCDPSGTGQL